MTTIAEIYTFLDEYCPFSTAESWDHPGLNVGWRERTACNILLAMDPTPEAVEMAKKQGCQLLITHHPLSSAALTQWNSDSYTGRVLLQLAEAGISHIACHTNLDKAEEGVNTALASCCGLEKTTVFGGFGRWGQTETTVQTLVETLKKNLPTACCMGVVCHEEVRRLAVVGGSGGSLLEEAAALGCDTLVTGEAKHHQALVARELGVNLLIFGHYETEYIALPPLADALQKRFPSLTVGVLARKAPLERL